MNKYKLLFIICITLVIGVVVGGLLFSRSISRTLLDVKNCGEKCFNKKEALGLLASIGIQNLGENLPSIIYETDKTLVFDIQYPYPPDKIHYAVVPKRDIKDMAAATQEDLEYLKDSFAVISNIVKEKNHQKYRVITNGPGYQEVTYLHFHLVIDRDDK
ncbi:MAG: HIT domain-containing protein [bacterium]|nr:HIT domain-containing protein [bacterium]